MASTGSHNIDKAQQSDSQSSGFNPRKRARRVSEIGGETSSKEQDDNIGVSKEITESSAIYRYHCGDSYSLDDIPVRELAMDIPRHTEEGFAKAIASQAKSTWKLPPRQIIPIGRAPFKRIQLLQRNAFKEIDKVEFTGADAITGKVYVRKVLSMKPLHNLDESRNELKALEVPKSLSHKHLVSVVMTYEELATDDRHYGIVIEPVATGSLMGYLNHALDSKFPSPRVAGTIQKWFGCLASTLAYIHGRGITHGNINPFNILLKDEEILLTEFAISQHFDTIAATVETPFTSTNNRLYSAPEPIDADFLGSRADVFSLGCVFLEMISTVSGRGLDSLQRLRNGASYKQNLHRIPDFLAIVGEDLPTPFHRSMTLCCQSMLEMIPHSRRSSFNVARFIFEALERENANKGLAKDWLKCDCLCPWEATGGNVTVSL
jgi:serine/threonine protein kinase